jgi:cell division protein FtsQ
MDKRAVNIRAGADKPLPITMRAGAMGIPVIDRTRVRPRHILSIPFTKSGVDVKMPSVPDLKPGWRMLSGFLSMALIAALIFVSNTAKLRVNNLKVTGLDRIKASEIADAINVGDMPIYAVDPIDIKDNIEKNFPGLKDVSVSVSLPAVINLSVIERQPVLAWQYNDLTVWVDAEGYLFPVHGKAGNLLTIHAESAPPLKSITEDPEAADILTELATKPATKNAGKVMDEVLLNTALKLNKNLGLDSNLVYNNRNGLGWTDKNGWNVYIGTRLDDLDQKMVVYKGIANQFIKQGTVPAMVSVESLYAPYYRTEN